LATAPWNFPGPFPQKVFSGLSSGNMVSLSDSQLEIVTTAANAVPVERRGVFLERTAAMLNMRGRFSDSDVQDVTQLAMAGLVQTPTAAA
jgi:hypothetical protein